MGMILRTKAESWPLNKPFTISSQVFTHANLAFCEITDGTHVGRGEAAGVDYRGDDVQSILARIETLRGAIEGGLGRDDLQGLLGPGGARNALDCALWDLEAKRAGKSIWELLGRQPNPVDTLYTIGIDDHPAMTRDAAAHGDFPVLKVKVGADNPLALVAAVRAGAPRPDIVIDANQGLTFDELKAIMPGMRELGVKMIEQPLAVDADEALREYPALIPLCADESCQTAADLARLQGLYQFVNIKLDKTGGLTAALALGDSALDMGFELMVGNMLGTSLGMAPAFVIAQSCTYVDLDGPLLQSKDRDHPMVYERSRITVPPQALWG